MKSVYIFFFMISDVLYVACGPWSFSRTMLVHEIARSLQQYLNLYKQWVTNGPSRRRMPWMGSLARELREQTRSRLP
jgi:hypothetical protein